MLTKVNGINLYDSLMFINFVLPFFFKILQRYYKLAIFSILGMPGYDQ